MTFHGSPDAQRNILYRRSSRTLRPHVAQTFGEQQASAQNQLWTWRTRWATFLFTRRNDSGALQNAATLLADARKQKINDNVIVEMEIRLAALTNSIPAQLSKYTDPLPLDSLRNAANTLQEEGDAASARRVLEFFYTNQMKSGNLDQTTFLGLAEVKIEDKDMPGALNMLRRMVLISGEPFTGLDPAASLLERTHHPAEAAEFLSILVKAEPWNQDAKRRLAEDQGTAPAVTHPWDTLPTDAAAKEKALLAIIAADPRATAPRVLLIHAALDARHPALALAVMKQLTPTFREDMEFNDWMAKEFLPTLDLAERVSIARGLGDAQQRQGDARAALVYFRIAQLLAPSEATRRSITTLRAQVDADLKNESRRPLVNDSVEQDRLVRPKVGIR